MIPPLTSSIPENRQENIRSPRPHPRTIGWFGTTAVALGGSNQSLCVMAVLFIGQGAIPGQGSAAVLLLIAGILLAALAAPGWTELVLMYPNRVGGISACCAEAFRPYSPVLANLTGACYWWGWSPACAVGALLSAQALHDWYLPWFPVTLLGSCLIAFFTLVSLCGVKWVMRLAMPLATVSAGLAFLSALLPIVSGSVDWQQAFAFHLTVPFPGWFGKVTSVMAGLYLIGFLAPAFEQATSHVGETINPSKNVPRAVLASVALAGFYFIVLPVVWLGALGPVALEKDLAQVLGPTFAPLFGGAAKAVAVWFMVLNMFHGIIAPLAGAARTLSQLAEDGLLPECMGWRSRTDVPWVTTLITAGTALICLFAGVPLWVIAAGNFTYLMGIAMPSIAVWLLRRNEPGLPRPYRAPRGTVVLGLFSAAGWMIATVLGFQQFGLPTVLAGIAFAYSGSILYSWRKMSDRRKAGLPLIGHTLHLKLTGAMLAVLVLDGIGYLIAVHNVSTQESALVAMLADIFVVVAMLTIAVGLVLPGMIAHAAVEISKSAEKLITGPLTDFSRAMHALATGNLDAAQVTVDISPVKVHSRDEVGDMALNFNRLQDQIGHAAQGLEGARKGLIEARAIAEANASLRIDLAEMQAMQRSAAALRESEERFRCVAEAAADAIIIADENGLLISWNRAAQVMFGYEAEELVGCPLMNIVPERFRRHHENGLRQCFGTGPLQFSGNAIELVGLRKDGSEFPTEHSLATWRTEAGTFFSAIIRDITERKQAEAALRASQQQLLEAARRAGMAEVATSVLHNVGNVLNSVNTSVGVATEKIGALKSAGLGRIAALLHEHEENLPTFFSEHPQGVRLPKFLGQLADHFMTDQQMVLRELALLQTNLEHINEIVAMQQSYAGQGGVIEVLPLTEMIEDALRVSSAELDRRGTRVVREFDSSLPPLPVDRHKMLLILVNLIRNARHACDEAGHQDKCITLRAHWNKGGYAKISVSDNGVGISSENLTRIFEHGFTTRKNGHGFGLHSSALAAQDMGGALRVHSDGPGHGSTFTIELPIDRPSLS